MKGCGIKWFSTQKIFWTYNGADPFPYNIFWWQGIDGTKMLSYLHNDYNSQTFPNAIFARWRERVQKDSIHSGRLVPFGYGDGGGGPTRNHLEFLRREADLEGLPKTRIVEPKEYFEAIDEKAAAAAEKSAKPAAEDKAEADAEGDSFDEFAPVDITDLGD